MSNDFGINKGDKFVWYDNFDKIDRTITVLSDAVEGYVMTESEGVTKRDPVSVLATMARI
jgi:hypothetical protein